MKKWWDNLSPQQRRYAAVIGMAALLGLAVLLRRKGGPVEGGEGVSPGQAPVMASPSSGAPFEPESTFADNGEAAGQLGTAITEGLGAVGEGLGRVDEGLERVDERLGSLGDASPGDLPPIAPGPAGEIGLPAGGQVKQARKPAQKVKKPQRPNGAGGKSAIKPKPKKPASGSGGAPAPAPRPVQGAGGGVAQVGGAGGASGGQVHPNAYSSGRGVGQPKPNPPAGYHTYKGANGQWWFAPN